VAYTFRHGDRPLDGYTIQRAVGRGGFGEVYYAVSDGGREVALKYLRENPNVELRGISHCMNLKSPHLVSIFDVRKNADGEYFVIMEYVSGPSLRDLLLAEPAGLGPQKAAFFIREIAKGLAYLHDRGIVHRDMKPGNIFYDEGYVKIGDYGLSKFISVSRHSAQTASVGTVHYMAPEVGSGNYHRGIDIYALGVILYEMLLGRVPYEGGSMGEVLLKHLTAQPEVDNLPAPFSKVIRKALEKDPAERYQSVYEMVDDLLEVSDVQASLAGFNPASLDSIARRPAVEPFDSPQPSPNPAPRQIPPVQRQPLTFDLDARPLPPKLAKRIAGVSDRVEKRLRKLDARHGSRAPVERGPAAPAMRAKRHAANAPRSGGEVVQRLLLALAMAVGLGIGLGFLVDAREEGFASAIMMIVGMSGGVTLGMYFIAHLGKRTTQPRWIERICLTVPTAALVGIGVLPFADLHSDAGFGVWLALLAVTFFADWREHAETGAHGEMSIWRAGKVALFAFILCAIFNSGPNDPHNSALALATGVAAATSFVMQALGWLFPLTSWLDGVPAAATSSAGDGPGAASAPQRGPRGVWDSAKSVVAGMQNRIGQFRPHEAAPADDSAIPSAPGSAGEPAREAPSFLVAAAPRRRLITRVFAGLLFLGTLAALSILLVRIGFAPRAVAPTAVVRFSDGVAAVAVGETRCSIVPIAGLAAGAFGLMLLAVRKMSRYRTGPFYRDTLRPLLMALVLAGLAMGGTSLAVEVSHGFEALVVITVLVLLAMAFLFLLIKRGRAYPTGAEYPRAGEDPRMAAPAGAPESAPVAR